MEQSPAQNGRILAQMTELEHEMEVLRGMVAQAPVKIAYIDRERRFRLISRGYLSGPEADREGAVGSAVRDVLDPEHYRRLEPAMNRALAGQVVQFDDSFPTPTGALRRTRAVYLPDRGPDGQVCGFFAMVQDVSERLRLEQQLHLAEERFGAIVRNTADGIVMVDGEQRIVLFNPGAETIFGYGAAEVLGEPLAMLIPEHLREIHHKDVQAFGRSEQPARLMRERSAVSGLRKDGSEFPAEASIASFEQDGQRYFTAIVRDVSERVRVETALKESRQQLQMVADSLPVLISYLDAEGRARFFNEQGARWCGREAAALLELTLPEIFGAEEAAKLNVPVVSALEGQPAQTEVTLRFPDGRTRAVEAYLVPQRPVDGRPRGTYLMMTDVSEQKRANEALRASAEYHRLLFQESPIGLVLRRVDGSLVDVNPAFARIIGRTMQETLELSLDRLMPGKYREADRGCFDEARLEGRYGPCELEYYHRDGHLVPVQLRGRRIFQDGEEFLWSSVEDITDRRRTEEMERRLANAQRIARLGNWDRDIESGKLWWSDETYRIFGLQPHTSAPTLDSFLEAVHPEDRERVRAAFDQALISRQEYSADHRILLPSGEERIVHEQGEAEYDDAGRPVRMVGTVQDVTDRERMLQELALSEARFRNLVDGSIQGTVILDRLQPMFANPSFASMLGCDSVEALLHGPGLDKRLNAADAERYLELAEQVRGNPDAPTDRMLWRVERADGKPAQLEVFFRPVRWYERDAMQVTSIDVSQRAALEGQLRHAQKMEAVGQLAGGVAHDFNNVLQIIRGYTELAGSRGAADDAIRADLAKVMKAADAASDLTRQLLAFSRREMLRPQHVDMNDLIRNQMKMVRRLIGEDIELNVVEGVEDAAVYGDPGLLEQIILNLCVNARDAMPSGGRLTLETQPFTADAAFCDLHPWAVPGPYVLIQVTDTGTGMTPEVREHIFEPFFTTKEAGKGTGLGLSTVYGIARQHRGMITVQSRPGTGTRFRIFLPRADAPGDEVAVELPEEAEGGGETILVAEDEEAVRFLLVRLLERKGYRVLQAADGPEAQSVFDAQRDRIDLVISDMVMPKFGGRELFEHIQTVKPEMPVLLCTGYTAAMLDQDFVKAQGEALLRKPYSPHELYRMVRRSLDRRAS